MRTFLIKYACITAFTMTTFWKTLDTLPAAELAAYPLPEAFYFRLAVALIGATAADEILVRQLKYDPIHWSLWTIALANLLLQPRLTTLIIYIFAILLFTLARWIAKLFVYKRPSRTQETDK